MRTLSLCLCNRPELPREVDVESLTRQLRSFYARVVFANEVSHSLKLAALEAVACSFSHIGCATAAAAIFVLLTANPLGAIDLGPEMSTRYSGRPRQRERGAEGHRRGERATEAAVRAAARAVDRLARDAGWRHFRVLHPGVLVHAGLHGARAPIVTRAERLGRVGTTLAMVLQSLRRMPADPSSICCGSSPCPSCPIYIERLAHLHHGAGLQSSLSVEPDVVPVPG